MTQPGRAIAHGEAGFTLIEVVISLALMALIAMAGFTLLQGIISTRDRTEGRLERTAQLQRAMFTLTDDFEQIADGPLTASGEEITFSRLAPSPQVGRQTMRYTLRDGALRREVGAVSQALIDDVGAVTWSFYTPEAGWAQTWRPPGDKAPWPAAIAVDITLAARPDQPGGLLRRVVELPTRPTP